MQVLNVLIMSWLSLLHHNCWCFENLWLGCAFLSLVLSRYWNKQCFRIEYHVLYFVLQKNFTQHGKTAFLVHILTLPLGHCFMDNDLLHVYFEMFCFCIVLPISSSWKRESARINRTNIVICTPGRLLQHMDETVNFTVDSLQMLGTANYACVHRKTATCVQDNVQ